MSDAQRLLYSGSVNAGKTYVGCAKAYLLSLKYPSNRGLIVRKDLTSLRDSTLLTLLKGDPKTDPVIPSENVISHNKTEHKIEIAGPEEPSEILYTGLESTKKGSDYPTSLGSSQFGWIFVDEAVEIKKEDWLFLESRLRHPVDFQQIFAATNPAAPTHWLYDMFIESEDPDSQVIHANIYDNPFVSDSYRERLEKQYSGAMKERLLKGKWSSAEGLVYPDFSRQTHVKDSPNSHYKTVIVGADSGWTNPRALLIIGITGDDRYYCLDEFYRSQTPVEDAVDWLKSWAKRKSTRIYRIYHDPSAPSDIEVFKNDFTTKKANTDVRAGISQVSKLLREERLFVSPKCENLIKEFNSYHYSNKKDEQPVKEMDHLMDSLRYAVLTYQGSSYSGENRFELIRRGEKSKRAHRRDYRS
ncbi:MAG: PBSX family phage terminase large subunit [Candidatus Aenigmatarchaeota archaeon]